MNIKVKHRINKIVNNKEQPGKNKTWLSFVLGTVLLSLTVVLLVCKNIILFADSTYSTDNVKPTTSTYISAYQDISNRAGSGVANSAYNYTIDTGATLLLIGFQEKEIYNASDSLEKNVTSNSYLNKTYLSGYTITNQFDTLGYKEGTAWASLGKIYAEYGTLGLTGVNQENKIALIEDVLATDFPDEKLNAADCELLNGLAYRSNVITMDRINRSLIYVPRSLAIYDDFSSSRTYYNTNKSANYTSGKIPESHMAAFVGPFLNKFDNLDINGHHQYKYTDADIKKIQNTIATAMNYGLTGEQKADSALIMEKMVATAWPILVCTENGDQMTALVSSNVKTYDVLPNSSLDSPFAYHMYYVEDTRHDLSTKSGDYVEKVAKRLDESEELKGWKTATLDEEALHESLMEYYKGHIDMAYAVLDAVFGGIKEYPLTISNGKHKASHLIGTDYIDFEEKLEKWLSAGINNYAETEDRAVRVAGIRQAELNCALGSILQHRFGETLNVDTKSNIEITLISVYTSEVGPAQIDSYDDVKNYIRNNGWKAWDTILWMGRQCYATTYETTRNFLYEYNDLVTNRKKVSTLATTVYQYATSKVEFPMTIDNSAGSLIFNKNYLGTDVIMRRLINLGTVPVRYFSGEASALSLAHVLYAGIDEWYPSTVKPDKTQLIITDEVRQSYLLTILSRLRHSTSDKVTRGFGFNNKGLLGDGLYTGFTGYSSSDGGIIHLGSDTRINGNKIPKSVYDVSWPVDMSGFSGSYNLKASERTDTSINGDKYIVNISFTTGNNKLVYYGTAVCRRDYTRKVGYKTDYNYSDNTNNAISAMKSITSAAGSIEISQFLRAHQPKIVVGVNNETTKIIAHSVGTNANWSQYGHTPLVIGESNAYFYAMLNVATSNIRKTAWSSFVVTADNFDKLNEENTELIEKEQSKVTVANATGFYLYNRTLYNPSEEFEVQAVLGFQPLSSVNNKVTHTLAPIDAASHQLTLGLNFSGEAIEALQAILDNGETPRLAVTLSGMKDDLGRSVFTKYIKTTEGTKVELSQFDTELTTLHLGTGIGGLGYIHELALEQLKQQVQDFIDNEYSWTNWTKGYQPHSLTDITNSDVETGDIIYIDLTEDMIKKIAELAADDPTAINSDDTYQLKVKDWVVTSITGSSNQRLSNIETSETLAINTVYSLGVEVQMYGIKKDEVLAKDVIESLTYYNPSETDLEYYTTIGLGAYNKLYYRPWDNSKLKIIAMTKNDTERNGISSATDHIRINNKKYGEGTDNHVYFEFKNTEIKEWQFTGTATLFWDTTKTKSAELREPGEALGANVNSVLNFAFNGGETTRAKFYETLKNANVKYIAVAVSEGLAEATLEPNPKTNTDDLLAPNWNEVLNNLGTTGTGSNALGQFEKGCLVYTLDTFMELIGGATEETTAELTIENKYKNYATAGLIANDPADDIQGGADEYENNRFEFDLLASFYAIGDYTELASVANTDTLVDSLAGAANSGLTFLDITNGLSYVLKAGDTTSDNFELAYAHEYINLDAAGLDTTLEETFLYFTVANNTPGRYTLYIPEADNEGSGFVLDSSALVELNEKPANVINLGDSLAAGGNCWVVATVNTIPPEEPLNWTLRTSAPMSYAQVKNGKWTDTATADQDWNTLTGIPSTEMFYITSGGTEFIIELEIQETIDETAYRSYISYFGTTPCKFKIGDTSSAGGGSTTSVTKDYISHELHNESIVGQLTDTFRLPDPVGNSSGNWHVSQHAGDTITVTWTGTIPNTTSDPGVEDIAAPWDKVSTTGEHYSGKPGKMIKSGQEQTGGYSWDVSKYNEALTNAQNWAKQMEDFSDSSEGNITILSASDGQAIRHWHAGDAVITTTFGSINAVNNGNSKMYHVSAHEATLTNYVTDTSGWSVYLLEGNDARLSSGYFEGYGHADSLTAASCKSSYSRTGQYDEDQTDVWMDEVELKAFLAGPGSVQQTHEYTKNYVWNGSETSVSAQAEKATLTGKLNWCGAPWFEGEDAQWSQTCGMDYHEHGPSCFSDPDPANHCEEDEHLHSGGCITVTPSTKATTGHACEASHSAGGYIQTKTVKAPDLTYNITVTFINTYTTGQAGSYSSDPIVGQQSCPGGVVPAHSLCGPCCEHQLKAIADAWVQHINYKTYRITDVRVNKISRNYVEGINNLTLEQKDKVYLLGNIAEGDVNIFYNIATMNETYRDSLFNDAGWDKDYAISTRPVNGASLAGRLRHSVQAQQHDTVLWDEYNKHNVTARTNDCDGQDATKTGSNPVQDGGRGHEEKWALGILYSRNADKGTQYYTTSGDFNDIFTHKGEDTQKWLDKCIEANAGTIKIAYTNNTLDARDVLTHEYLRFKERRETENTVKLITDTLILQGTKSGDYKVLYESATATKTTEEDIDKTEGLITDGKVTFGVPTPGETYLYQGQGIDTDIHYDILVNASNPINSPVFGGYLGNGNTTLDNQTTKSTAAYSTLFDSNNTQFDATSAHPDAKAAVPGPKAYDTVTMIVDSTDAEVFKSSPALMQKRITTPEKALRIGQLDIQIDPSMQNGLYDTKKSTQTWFQILNYTEPDTEILLDNEYYKPNTELSGDYDGIIDVPVFIQEAYYYGSSTTGYLAPAHKVNGVVVHSPISVINNYLVVDPDAYNDQRITVMQNDFTGLKGCPANASLCEYSYLDCSYDKVVTVFNLNFEDTFNRIDTRGKVTTYNTFGIDAYGYITSILDSASYLTIPVRTGFMTKINDEHGQGISINGTRLVIPFKKLGVNYITGTQMQLTINGAFSNDTYIFESGDISAKTTSTGLIITNGKATYNYYYGNSTDYHNYVFVIDYNGLDKFTLSVDGLNVPAVATGTFDNSMTSFVEADWSETLSIGQRCKLYGVQLKHLPGSITHDTGCYQDVHECEKFINYSCDDYTRFTGSTTPQEFKAAVSGTYLLELYDGAGTYKTAKVVLQKGESIYAYLGSKGYWSKSGTDKAEKITYNKDTSVQGLVDGVYLNPGTTVLNKTSGTGSITLTPGYYELQASGAAGTGGAGGQAYGQLKILTPTTVYWSVGTTAKGSWINLTNSAVDALTFGGGGATAAIAGSSNGEYTHHEHASGCNVSYDWRDSQATGYEPITVDKWEYTWDCSYGSGPDADPYCSGSGSYYYYVYNGTQVYSDGEGCSCPGEDEDGYDCWDSDEDYIGTATLYRKATYTCGNLPLNTNPNAIYTTHEHNDSCSSTYAWLHKDTCVNNGDYTWESESDDGSCSGCSCSDWSSCSCEGCKIYVLSCGNEEDDGCTYTKIYNCNNLPLNSGAIASDDTPAIPAETSYYNNVISGTITEGISTTGSVTIKRLADASSLTNLQDIIIIAETTNNTQSTSAMTTPSVIVNKATGASNITLNKGIYLIEVYNASNNGVRGWLSVTTSSIYYYNNTATALNFGLSGYGDLISINTSTDTKSYQTNTSNGLGKYLTDVNTTSVGKAGITITKYADLSSLGVITDINYTATTSESGALTNFSATYYYTGAMKSETLQPGIYTLEAYGAQGGGDCGGYGGYSKGTLTLNTETTLYIGVGGRNEQFNGGGYGADYTGGGATHIATSPGQLNSLSSNKSAVLLVAGGGGAGDGRSETVVDKSINGAGAGAGDTGKAGFEYCGTCGEGGGYYGGGAGGSYCGNSGSFGQGGSNTHSSDNGEFGGGGGYYGGGAGGHDCDEYSDYDDSFGGGGSGYADTSRLTDIEGTTGTNSGDGKVVITGQSTLATTHTLSNITITTETSTVKVQYKTSVSGNEEVTDWKYTADTSKIILTTLNEPSTNFETKDSDGYKWVKVFSHDVTGGIFASEAEALHTGNPTDKKYSILDYIQYLKSDDSENYVFMLVYPNEGIKNIWEQYLRPQDEYETDGDGTKNAVGYKAISVADTSGNWGGLVRSTSGQSLIDGSTYIGYWHYAIGAYNSFGSATTIPGTGTINTSKVELWVATDSDKLNLTAAKMFNSTVTTLDETTSAPTDSTYAWMTNSLTSVAQIRLANHLHTADCASEVNLFNEHSHTLNCIDIQSPAFKYLVYAAKNNLPNLNMLCAKYLGVDKSYLGSSTTEIMTKIQNRAFDLTLLPDTVDGIDNPILKCLNHNDIHVHTASCHVTNKLVTCNNLHHQGEHFDMGNPICYTYCNDDENHSKTKFNIDGTDMVLASAINLNSYFTIYWDNMGDFLDTERECSTNPSTEKGQGYVNGMDTTQWLKRKVIIFNEIDVLLWNWHTNEWTLHEAGTEISLPIVSDGIPNNGDDDQKRDWKQHEQNPITEYHFYCLENNNEFNDTEYQAWGEALNSLSSDGQMAEPYRKDEGEEPAFDLPGSVEPTNFKRPGRQSNFAALHSARDITKYDVMGSIGNLIITYTTDYRWSNFFKQADVDSGWLVDNILYEVFDDKQERYIHIGRDEDGRDVRNNKIGPVTGYFDTWNTEAWKHEATAMNTILSGDTLAGQTGYVWSKLAEDIKCGYDIYCEITTLGDYNRIKMDYNYYVMNKETGDVYPVDLWSKIDSNYRAYYIADEDAARVNQVLESGTLAGFYGIETPESLALYYLYSDLSTQSALRNVTQEQISDATIISAELDGGIAYEPGTNHLGEEDYISTWLPGAGPSLERIQLGTSYGISLDGRSRVFIGSSYDNWGLRDYSNGYAGYTYPRTIMDTNLGNVISADEFTPQARRWLFTAGVAENTVAVIYDGIKHVDLTTNKDNSVVISDFDTYALLIGVDIRAEGDVWNLNYEAFANQQSVLGKRISTDIPDIIAVYGLSSKEEDFDKQQTH